MLIASDLKPHLNILYEDTTTGRHYSINFTSEDFVWTGPITIQILLTNLNQNGINTTNIPTSPPDILDGNSNKYLLWTVDLNHLYT